MLQDGLFRLTVIAPGAKVRNERSLRRMVILEKDVAPPELWMIVWSEQMILLPSEMSD